MSEGSAQVILHLHTPKTAGTTLTSYLYEECRRHEGLVDAGGYFNDGVYYFPDGFFKPEDLALPSVVQRTLGRSDLMAVAGHFWYGVHEWVTRPWTYVTTLRDPVERIVSLFYHAQVHHSSPALARQSLRDFVEAPLYPEMDNDQTRRVAGTRPPTGSCSQADLERALVNLDRDFTVVGTTERMDEVFLLLRRRFGWSSSPLTYPKNVNASRPNVEAIADEVREAIEAKQVYDRRLYDRANELLDRAIAEQGPDFGEELAAFRAEKRAWLEAMTRRAGDPEAHGKVLRMGL